MRYEHKVSSKQIKNRWRWCCTCKESNGNGGRHTQSESVSCIKFITRHNHHHHHHQQQHRQQWKHKQLNGCSTDCSVFTYITWGIFRIVSFILSKLFACSFHTHAMSSCACEPCMCLSFRFYFTVQSKYVTFEMNECSVNSGKKMYLNNSTKKKKSFTDINSREQAGERARAKGKRKWYINSKQIRDKNYHYCKWNNV